MTADPSPIDCAQRMRDFIEASNDHDIERVLSFYTRDIRFEIVNAWVKQGLDDIRDLAEWDAETHGRMSVTDIHGRMNIIQCHLIETNDWFALAGIGDVHYEPCLFVFRDTLIREIRAEMTGESRQRYLRSWQGIIEWTTANRSKILLELMPGGKFRYGRERARKWIGLLQEWRDATGG